MRQTLRTWVADADTRQNLAAFALQERLDQLGYLEGRTIDLYFSLVGELFESLRSLPDDPRDWAILGNALAQLSHDFVGVTRSDALFFSAASFYSGGYSASAYLAMRQATPQAWTLEPYRACYDLLARPAQLQSQRVRSLLAAVRAGTPDRIEQGVGEAEEALSAARQEGPEVWVAERVYGSLLARFLRINVRSVLPDGHAPRWNALVRSFLNRTPPVWDFFPSQIDAVNAGLLTSDETYSLQMPTGSGKTALTETLMFGHLTTRPNDLAVLLVPYRALARELRNSLGRRLSATGLPTRTIYGGTVPTREESQDLEDVRAIVATPEALTGLLGRSPELLSRISLVICDEGHLLDEGARGVGLELLLSRFRGRGDLQPRMVFLSAIVPNIEEINTWLGGSDATVVRSEFRPAEAEYAVLRPVGSGRRMLIDLEMQPVSTTLQAHTLPAFLSARDFEFTNPATGRTNTYAYSSVKTQAVAAGRKSLAIGSVAVFAATKTGNQGAVGLAGELLKQLDVGLSLPDPAVYVSDADVVREVAEYLEREYGSRWVGTKLLLAGAVVHHGDIPQETREALEELLISAQVRMVLCTSTLAEGVNLPLRTLILYAVQRRSPSGQAIPMLAREIRNLVGRAGRAGSSTKGLVICANPTQWPDIRPVAVGEPGEDVYGALRQLLSRLQNALRQNSLSLTNDILEANPALYPLVDGIDATLIELIHEELGDEQFLAIASSLAARTFASQQIDREGQALLTSVFDLRAIRLAQLRTNARLLWVRDTGARARLLDSVVERLAPSLDRWDVIGSPLDDQLLDAVLDWAYAQPDFLDALREAYRADEAPPVAEPRRRVQDWISGRTFLEMAERLDSDVDTVLRIHGSIVTYAFLTLVEQGIALLERYLADMGQRLGDGALNLPEYLRFGVPTPAARSLMTSGMRHRRAAVALGDADEMTAPGNALRSPTDVARSVLLDEERWRPVLGDFMYRRTVQDVGAEQSS